MGYALSWKHSATSITPAQLRFTLQTPYYPARISYGNATRRYIVRHNASGSDRTLVAYRNAGQDNSPTAYPHVAAYGYGSRTRPPEVTLAREPLCGIGRMIHRIYMYPRPYSGMVADAYRVAVEEYAIHIYLDIVAQVDILAVIDKKRSRDPYILTARTEQTVEQRGYTYRIVSRRSVICRL